MLNDDNEVYACSDFSWFWFCEIGTSGVAVPGKRNGESGKAWFATIFETVGDGGGIDRINDCFAEEALAMIPAMTVGFATGCEMFSALVASGTFSYSLMDSDGGGVDDTVSSPAGC